MSQSKRIVEEKFCEVADRAPSAFGNNAAPMAEGVANDNAPASPAVVLHPTRCESDAPQLDLRLVGDGRAFIRALARIIVRCELISAGLIAAPEPCAPKTRAG